MKVTTFDQPADINPDLLHDELSAVLGAKYLSCDTGIPQRNADDTIDESKPRKIVVRAGDDANDADIAKIEALLKTHDSKKLSKAQQRDKDRKDAYQRFKTFDFAGLRTMKNAEQIPVIIGLLEDIQRLMLGTENG